MRAIRPRNVTPQVLSFARETISPAAIGLAVFSAAFLTACAKTVAQVPTGMNSGSQAQTTVLRAEVGGVSCRPFRP